jgi:hypothetical protein
LPKNAPQIDTVATGKLLTYLNAIPSPTVSRREINDAAADAGLPFPRWIVWTKTIVRGRWENFTPERCAALGLGYKITKRGRAGALAVHSSVSQKGPKVRVVRTPRPVSIPTPVASPTITVTGDAPASLTSVTATPVANATLGTAVTAAVGETVHSMLAPTEHAPMVPAVLPGYVPFGHFENVVKILESHHFLPTMIVGPSGDGKTSMVEQAAAAVGREYVRISITSQTDEDDLIGGFRLINGDTKFALGPIPMAMLSGAIALLDEVDLGGSSLMCLQPVLEGNPLFIKKLGIYITAKPGFNVLATANTKGRGDDGRYAHTNIMNEAMLERFAVMFDQSWPPADVERRILNHILRSEGKADATLVRHLVEFASTTRANFANQICNDQIATRRLIQIIKSYCVFGDMDTAMTLALARFDEVTAEGFKTLWRTIHDVTTVSPSGAAIPTQKTNAPF